MLPPLYLVVLVALCLSQQTQCDEEATQTAPKIFHEFSGNWDANGINAIIVKDFSYLIFQKNFTNKPEFFWVTHDYRYWHMVITEVSTDESKPSLRACKYAFSIAKSPATVHEIYPRTEKDEIDVKWTEKAQKEGESHLTRIKAWRCTSNYTVLNDLNSEPEKEEVPSSVEEAPNKGNQIKPNQGLYKQEIANVSFADPPPWARKSYAHNKFGHCWRQFYTRIYCEQYNNYEKTKKIMTVDRHWPHSFDWLTMYNLKDDALLVITGTCPNNHCVDYLVTKIKKNGIVREIFKVEGLNADYAEMLEVGSSNVDVYVSEDIEENRFCFHFVCLELKYTKENSLYDGRLLQYRRHCVSKDLFDG